MTENDLNVVRKKVFCQAPSIIETNETLGTILGDNCRSYENSIINFLDRWLPDDDGNPKGTYYAKEPFVNKAGRWIGTDIIYAQQHVDFKTETPRVKALSKVKTFEGEEGRVVGNVVKDWVSIDGHPRLMMHLNICDPVVNGHWKAGRLSQSSAFDCLTNTAGVIVDDINPDHLLVFVEDPAKDAIPRDPGSIINMKRTKNNCPLKSVEENHMPKEPVDKTKMENAGRVLSGDNASFLSGLHGKLKEIGDSLDGFLDKASPPPLPKGDGTTVPKEVPEFTVKETVVDKGDDGIGDVERKKFISGVDDETLNKMTDQLEGLDLSMVPEPLVKLLKTAQDESATRKNNAVKNTVEKQMTPEEKKKIEEEEAKEEEAAASEKKKMEQKNLENMAAIQTQLKNQQVVIDDYKRKEALAQEKSTRDGFETKFLANIKPAYRDTPEKIENLYKEYKTSPVSLLNRMPEMHIDAKAETKKEGMENIPDNAVSLVNSAPISPDHFTAGTPDGAFGYEPTALKTYVKNIQNLSKASTLSKGV
jgi:hypothetical protein